MLTLKIALSALMLLAGGAKVVGAKPLADQFEEFGLSRSMMVGVGILELAAGVGVQLAPVAFLASTGLALLMVGAVGHHRRVGHPARSVAPAVLVLVLSALHSVWAWPW